MSDRLFIGPRKLQRALKAESTSFREVRERFLEARARALLAEPDISIDAVARSLGYTETNSFRRAFRKWTGLPLGTYRSRLLVKASVPD